MPRSPNDAALRAAPRPGSTRPPLRVAIVTSIHLDFDARVWKHARSVAEAGCRVVLVCPWAVGDGEIREGVELRPFPRVEPRLRRPVLIPLRLARRLLPILPRIDIVHFHDLDILPWMTPLSLLRPVVYDVHENYPDEMLVRGWIPRPLRRPLSRLVALTEAACSRLVRNCVIVVPAQEPRFRPGWRRVVQIRNYATRRLLADAKDDYLSRKDVVVFTGSHHEHNGSMLILEIAARSRARGLDLRFLMSNRFASERFRRRFLAEIERRGLGDRVVVRPYVPPHQLMSLLNEATIGISPNLRVPTQEKAIPTKLFEYMAAGLPIVTSDLPNHKEIVAGADAGLVAVPEAPETFVEALARLVADREHARALGLNGRRAFVEHYSWESQVPALLRFYDDVVAGSSRSPAPAADEARALD